MHYNVIGTSFHNLGCSGIDETFEKTAKDTKIFEEKGIYGGKSKTKVKSKR